MVIQNTLLQYFIFNSEYEKMCNKCHTKLPILISESRKLNHGAILRAISALVTASVMTTYSLNQWSFKSTGHSRQVNM